MMQLELIEVDRTKHGATWWDGNWQSRNWHGWQQSREGGTGNWTFYVAWFGNDDVTCGVNCIGPDGSIHVRDGVPIDKQNRITIEGRKYGRDYWDH